MEIYNSFIYNNPSKYCPIKMKYLDIHIVIVNK